MFKILKSEKRGSTKIDWLDSWHSFSFGNYYNPEYLGFGNLLVINDDFIKGGGGFAEHGHKDMEIVTYIIEGELAHKDSLGNIATIKIGEVQRMSAGKGIRHSEFNYSKTDICRLLQIWFLPKNNSTSAGYQQKHFSNDDKKNNLKLIVSGAGELESLSIGADVKIYACVLDNQKHLDFATAGKKFWLQMAKGELQINDLRVVSGDGLAIEEEGDLKIISKQNDTEFLLFQV